MKRQLRLAEVDHPQNSQGLTDLNYRRETIEVEDLTAE
jgi:hypothetical protein